MNISEQKVIIRKSKKEDAKEIYDMIMELAVFEKMEDQVKINVKTLEEDGFSAGAAFSCFIAEISNEIVGYALFYTCYSTWLGKSIFLEDLYVKMSYRKKGIGKQLIKAVARVAYETNGRLDFHVLSWNPATEFYKTLGAQNLSVTEKWQLFRLDKDNLKNFVK